MAEEFDYIVVGAGSAGCVLGARLSEDASVRVLVLEAGGRDWMPLYKVPMFAGILFRKRYNNWNYVTEPEPGLDGRRLNWPRGKVLGGSNQINGMVYTRGHRLDYDSWRQMGCEGWSYDDVLPLFMKSEDFRGPDSAHHGKDGPLTVRRGRATAPLYDALVEAGAEAGYPVTEDFNEPEREGFGRYHFTIRDGRRWTTAQAFLKPAMRRPNLAVRTGCHTTGIVVERGRAVGLRYRRKGRTHDIRARREIVLSGGAINSPQLLLLSGIGPADGLRAAGMPVVHDLPGVGENLHDHLVARLQYACNAPVGIYDELRLDRAAWHALNALLRGRGFGADFALQGGCFIRTRPELAAPDIQLNFVAAMKPVTHLPFARPGPDSGHGFYAGVHMTVPESRGRLWLASDDPFAPPRIHANYLATENDRRTMRDGVRIMRAVFRQPAIARYIERERVPGPEVESDAELDAWIRSAGDTVFHPVGTCKMGTDGMAVVDPRLRVRGVDGLRIADASIMPAINGSNTNAPTIMIAEKAAAMIAEDREKGKGGSTS